MYSHSYLILYMQCCAPFLKEGPQIVYVLGPMKPGSAPVGVSQTLSVLWLRRSQLLYLLPTRCPSFLCPGALCREGGVEIQAQLEQTLLYWWVLSHEELVAGQVDSSWGNHQSDQWRGVLSTGLRGLCLTGDWAVGDNDLVPVSFCELIFSFNFGELPQDRFTGSSINLSLHTPCSRYLISFWSGENPTTSSDFVSEVLLLFWKLFLLFFKYRF